MPSKWGGYLATTYTNKKVEWKVKLTWNKPTCHQKLKFWTTGYKTFGDGDGPKAGVYKFRPLKTETLFLQQLSNSGWWVHMADSKQSTSSTNALYHWRKNRQIGRAFFLRLRVIVFQASGISSFSRMKPVYWFTFPSNKRTLPWLTEEIVNVEFETCVNFLFTLFRVTVNSERKDHTEAVIHLNKKNKLIQIAYNGTLIA
jgi:hypothetical protein